MLLLSRTKFPTMISLFCVTCLFVQNGFSGPLNSSGDAKQNLMYFLESSDKGEQIKTLEKVSESIDFSGMVSKKLLATFNKDKQATVEPDIEKARLLFECAAKISRNAGAGLYTEEEMIIICKNLTKLQPKLLKQGQVGAINIELQNVLSLLQCSLIYRILSNRDFPDYQKLNCLGLKGYPNRIMSKAVLKKIFTDETGITFEEEFLTEEDMLISVAKSAMPELSVACEETNHVFVPDDLEHLKLVALLKKVDAMDNPLDKVDAVEFASNYYMTKKTILYTRLAILLAKIESEEDGTMEEKRLRRIERFEKEFLKHISKKEASIIKAPGSEEFLKHISRLERISRKEIPITQNGPGLAYKVLWQIRQDRSRKDVTLSRLVRARCSRIARHGHSNPLP